jgi:hypothetical protein
MRSPLDPESALRFERARALDSLAVDPVPF